MDTQKITDWVQIATGVALLVGLGLVILEFRQSRNVAHAQLTSDGFAQYDQVLISQMGESPAMVLAKSCQNPQSLTDEELMVLDAFFNAITAGVQRAYTITERSGLYEEYLPYVVRTNLPTILGSVAGRAWWEGVKEWYPDLQAAGDAVMQATPPVGECWINSWRQRIADASGVE